MHCLTGGRGYFHTYFICSNFGDGSADVRVVSFDGNFFEQVGVDDLEVVPTSKCCRLCLARQQ